ncbi:hypothetical protein EGW08_018980, partial [Elysia chlorotica]
IQNTHTTCAAQHTEYPHNTRSATYRIPTQHAQRNIQNTHTTRAAQHTAEIVIRVTTVWGGTKHRASSYRIPTQHAQCNIQRAHKLPYAIPHPYLTIDKN